jgi:anti-sigma factor RsiW
MVNGAQTHPNDLELLDLVEGDLPKARATEVAAHVERCTRRPTPPRDSS